MEDHVEPTTLKHWVLTLFGFVGIFTILVMIDLVLHVFLGPVL